MKLKITFIFLFVCMAFSYSLFAQIVYQAHFPGGEDAWNKYLNQQIQMYAYEFKKKDIGT